MVRHYSVGNSDIRRWMLDLAVVIYRVDVDYRMKMHFVHISVVVGHHSLLLLSGDDMTLRHRLDSGKYHFSMRWSDLDDVVGSLLRCIDIVSIVVKVRID